MKNIVLSMLGVNDSQELRNPKVISYSSDGKPFSFYDNDNWVIINGNVNISFGHLSGNFKSKCKEIIYSEFNSNRLVNKKSLGTRYVQAFVILEKCITECGGDSLSYLNSDKGFRDFVSVAKSKKLRYKTWKNYLIILPILNNDGVVTRKIENADALAILLSGDQQFTQQTLALPENIASCYFKSALDTVSKYHPYRKSISDTYRSSLLTITIILNLEIRSIWLEAQPKSLMQTI